MGDPALVVLMGRFGSVAAVDEQEAEGRGPVLGHRRRFTDDGDDRILQVGAEDRPPEVGQGVHQAGLGVHQVGLVVLPARLVLLRAAVVVHREQHGAGLGRRGAEVDRGLAAVGADLEERAG